MSQAIRPAAPTVRPMVPPTLAYGPSVSIVKSGPDTYWRSLEAVHPPPADGASADQMAPRSSSTSAESAPNLSAFARKRSEAVGAPRQRATAARPSHASPNDESAARMRSYSIEAPARSPLQASARA
jgi:hypothetical protein